MGVIRNNTSSLKDEQLNRVEMYCLLQRVAEKIRKEDTKK